MSDSAYGRVIYGYGPQDNEYLLVAGEKRLSCSTDLAHELANGPYCPQCGSHVACGFSCVPSPLVEAYAVRHRITPEEALGSLEPYQHYLSTNEGDRYFFGILLAEGSHGTRTFRLVDSNDSLDRSILEYIQGKALLEELFKYNLQGARYHLLVGLR